jgi:hypothetical protein
MSSSSCSAWSGQPYWAMVSLLAPVLGNEPGEVAEVEAVEQHLLVVTADGHDVRVGRTEAKHLFDDLADLRATIDQIAEEDDLVVLEVPGDVAFKLFELTITSMDVTDHVGAHGIYDLAVQGRVVRSGRMAVGSIDSGSPRHPH